ncbi:MAG: N-acetylmuramoyl-L-alanine amidase [Elusimicrobiota bacterium]
MSFVETEIQMHIKNYTYIAVLAVCFFMKVFCCAGELSGKIIVVDPGHAAKNSQGKVVNLGCKSPSGIKEADGVVDISEILGDILLREGATVYFTRDRKNFWRLAKSQHSDNQDRAEFANSKIADLFLRVHCNWSPTKKKRGVSVLWYKADSKKIAETVYEKISATGGKSGVIADGVHKQHLVGFEFAKVPSILIEYGYLSNKEDEKLLQDKEYLKKISEAVVHGLEK